MMIPLRLWVVLALLLGSSTAWAKPKIAILGLEIIGSMDPQQAEVARDLTSVFRSRAGSGVFSLASNSRKELVDEKLMGNCSTEALVCMAAIANNLGAEFLLYGHLEKVPRNGVEGYQISLWLLKVSTRPTVTGSLQDTHVEWRAAKELTGNTLTRWVDTVYIKMSGEKVEKPNGKLVVRVANAAVGTVYIDGSERGALNGGRITVSLPEGSYKVAVEADGFQRHEETGVRVTSGSTRDYEVELQQRDTQSRRGGGGGGGGKSRKKLYLGLAGAGLLAVGTTTGLLWARAYSGPIGDYKDLLVRGEGAIDIGNHDAEQLDSDDCGKAKPDPAFPEQGTPAAERATKFTKACSAYTQIYYLAATTFVTGLAGVGMLAYVLLSGPADERNGATSLRLTRSGSVALQPVVTPHVSGAILRLSW